MRSALVIVLACAAASGSAQMDHLLKFIPTSIIHQKISGATSALDEVQNRLGGAGKRLLGALDKIRDVLSTIDAFFKSKSEPEHHEDVLPDTTLDSVPEDKAPPVKNAFAKRDATAAQVSFTMPWQTSRSNGPYQYYDAQPFQYSQRAYSQNFVPMPYSQRDMSSAQIPYSQRAYRRAYAQRAYTFMDPSAPYQLYDDGQRSLKAT